MKVLCVVPQNVKHETDMFIGLQNQGIEIHVITGKKVEPDYTKLINAGIPVDIITFKKRLDRNGISTMRALLTKTHFDIIHAFNNKTVSNALAASKGYAVKFIAYRGIVGNVSFLNPYSWMTYLNPRVDKIICVANAIRDHLLQLNFLGMKIAAHKPVTIYKGHDLAWYQNPPADLTEFGITENDFVVGCVANFRPRKGINILIESTQYLPQDANIHFLLIGDMNSHKLQQQIQQSPYRDKIHLAGFRNNAPEMLAACDACILPSIKREGLPKSVIEGMVYAIPPIVTNSGGSPELVEHNVSGLVVPPKSAKAIADAILYLQQNPSTRKAMGIAAREHIHKHFNVNDTITNTYRLYQELIPPN